jgi:hypothetical protein
MYVRRSREVLLLCLSLSIPSVCFAFFFNLYYFYHIVYNRTPKPSFIPFAIDGPKSTPYLGGPKYRGPFGGGIHP